MRVAAIRLFGAAISLATALGFASASAQTPPPAETLPSMKFVKGAPVSPDDAIAAYGAGTTHSSSFTGVSGFQGQPPEIVENAKGLNNDPDLIFEYVRNHVKTEFAFGSRKGPLGALIDKSATPFDQNILFVEMVRAAGHTARYRISKATFTGQAFTDWTGISDRRAACQMLASGGIPVSFPGVAEGTCPTAGAISSLTILHIWSQVKIGDDWWAYDPSYKKLTAPTPKDLVQASGFTPGTVADEAEDGLQSGTDGAPYIRQADATAVENYLRLRGTAMANNFHNTAFVRNADQILGIGQIVPEYMPEGGWRNDLPPDYTVTLQGLILGQTADIPDQYRTKLTVSLTKYWQVSGGTDSATVFSRVLYPDETYGRRLGINTNFNDQEINQAAPDSWTQQIIRLELDDVVLNSQTCTAASSGACQRGLSGRLSLAIDHPFVGPGSGFADQTIVKDVQLTLPLAIINGFGKVSPDLGAKWQQERSTDSRQPVNSIPDFPCPGEPPGQEPWCNPINDRPPTGDFTRQTLASAWLAEFSRMLEIQAAMGDTAAQHHHSLGVVAPRYELSTWHPPTDPFPTRTYYGVADIYDDINMDTAVSLTSEANDAAKVRVLSRSVALAGATLEASVLSSKGGLADVASTATRFAWGNAPETNGTGDATDEDPCHMGPRRFYDYTGTTEATRSTRLLYQGFNTGGCGAGPPFLGIPSAIFKSSYEGVVAKYVADYSCTGCHVIGSAETFLGPGTRYGPVAVQEPSPVNKISEQRGGALVATKVDGQGAITQIAHILSGRGGRISKGGGGKEPERAAEFDPLKAADVLKDRFVDRSVLLGVDLKTGAVGYTTPTLASIGAGDAPYGLDYSLTFKAAPDSCQTYPCVGPTQGGWIHNWDVHLDLSGSGMEAMGATHVEAAATSLIAFMAIQDVYADDGLCTDDALRCDMKKDVFAALAADWWLRQITGNVVTVSEGASGRQYVKRLSSDAEKQWLAPVGSPSVLTQTGSRAKVRDVCYTPTSAAFPYATARRWDISGVDFKLREADGVETSFADWVWNYDPNEECSKVTGFKVTTRTWPHGPAVEFVTRNPQVTSGDPTDVIGVKTRLSGIGGGVTRSFDLDSLKPLLATFTVPAGNLVAGLDNPSSVKDAEGAVWSYTYSGGIARGAAQRPIPYLRLAQIKAPPEPSQTARPVLSYAYDPLGRAASVADATALQWGTRGPYLFKLADGGRGERVEPAVAGVSPARGYVVYYDADGDAVRFIDEEEDETTAKYDGRHRVTLREYPEKNRDLFEYDDRDNVVELTRQGKPNSGVQDIVIQAQWNATWNKPDWITRPRYAGAASVRTDFTYFAAGHDDAGLLQKAERPAVTGGRPTYSYDYSAVGLVTSEVDPTGVTTTHNYNAKGDRLWTRLGAAAVGTNPALNLETTFTPDDYGNVVTATDPRGFATTAQYDKMRRKTAEQSRNGGAAAAKLAEAAWTYDEQGRVIEEKHAITIGTPNVWATTTTAYTPTGKAWRVTDPDGKATTTAYDRADRVSSVTDATGRTTAFTYDLAGRKLTEVRGVGSPAQATYATYAYTANGQVASVTDANANRTGYTYDGHDRLFRTRFPKPEDGEPSNQDTEELTYDAPGNVVSRKTRGGTLIAMSYDALERMTSKAVPAWNAVPARATTYAYDLAGRRTQVSDDWGHSLTWAYADAAGRNTSAGAAGPQWTGTKTIQFQYDAASNRTRLTWAPTGNYYVEYAYDALSRMDTASEVVSGGAPTLLADFTYDALSRRTAAKLGTKNAAVTWDYSDAGDLLTLAHDLTPNANDVTYAGTFDAAHRLATETTSNALYQWTGTTVGSDAYTVDRLNRYGNVDGQTFGYDGNSNLASDGANQYTYDPENRLLTALVGGVTWQYAYDPLGRRVSKQQAGGVGFVAYLSDGDDEIAEYNANGVTVRRYVPSSEIDRPIAMVSQNGTRTYFHADRRGSIVAMAADDGAIAEGPYSYDAYGAPSATGGVAYKYTGRRYDAETGLYYYRARYYNPVVGRFLQTDPIGYVADLNLYAYVLSDPINRADPMGLAPGDAFTSARAAAIDAIQFINARSIETKHEFAGSIYYREGKYYSTIPNEGDKYRSVSLPIPEGAILIKRWHTHGSKENPDCCNSDSHSDADRISTNTEYDNMVASGYTAHMPEGDSYTSILGTPSGDIKEYDPRKRNDPDRVQVIGRAPSQDDVRATHEPSGRGLEDLGGILVGNRGSGSKICADPTTGC